MKGFIRNEGERPKFILQRGISPGLSITFEEAYDIVGKKSGKRRGPTFINWLRENHFSAPTWVFYKEEGETYFEGESLQEVASVRPARGAGKTQIRRDDSKEKEDITAQQIINSELVIAKQLIDKCKDRAVLKKALTASRHYSGKEAHMRHLIRRLEQVYF
jgi:hypothetical protein